MCSCVIGYAVVNKRAKMAQVQDSTCTKLPEQWVSMREMVGEEIQRYWEGIDVDEFVPWFGISFDTLIGDGRITFHEISVDTRREKMIELLLAGFGESERVAWMTAMARCLWHYEYGDPSVRSCKDRLQFPVDCELDMDDYGWKVEAKFVMVPRCIFAEAMAQLVINEDILNEFVDLLNDENNVRREMAVGFCLVCILFFFEAM